MQKWAEGFYKSTQWQRVREYVYRRDGLLCQDCLKRGIYTPAEEVHHITSITQKNITDADITLNPDNLISLCRNCHALRHSKRRYTVDKLGRVTVR